MNQKLTYNKLIIILTFFLALISVFLVSCSSHVTDPDSGEAVKYDLFYAQVIGFTDSIEIAKPIPKDAVLLLTNSDFHKFKEKYFTPRQIPMEEPDSAKAVLFLQISSKNFSIKTYSVKGLYVKNNTLTVNLKQEGNAALSISKGFENAVFKWVMLIEVDKTQLKDNTKIVVNLKS